MAVRLFLRNLTTKCPKLKFAIKFHRRLDQKNLQDICHESLNKSISYYDEKAKYSGDEIASLPNQQKQDQQIRADAVHYQEPISICPAADILCIFVHFQALIHQQCLQTNSLNEEEIMVPNSPVQFKLPCLTWVCIIYNMIYKSSIAFSFSDLSPLVLLQKGNRGHFPNSSFLFKSTWSNLWK